MFLVIEAPRNHDISKIRFLVSFSILIPNEPIDKQTNDLQYRPYNLHNPYQLPKYFKTLFPLDFHQQRASHKLSNARNNYFPNQETQSNYKRCVISRFREYQQRSVPLTFTRVPFSRNQTIPNYKFIFDLRNGFDLRTSRDCEFNRCFWHG